MQSAIQINLSAIREPVWLTRLHLFAIFACLVLACVGGYFYYIDRSDDMLRMTIAAAALTLCMFFARLLIRRDYIGQGTILLHLGVIAFSAAMTRSDPEGWRILMFVPSICLAMAHAYLYARRAEYTLTVVWLLLSLLLLFGERQGLIPSQPWFVGIGVVNTISNVIGLILSLSWRYSTSVMQLGKINSDNASLTRVREQLEAQVLSSTNDLKEREARFRAVSELTSDYAFGWRVTPDKKILSEWSTDAITRVTGYTREDFERNWRAIVHPEDRQVYERRLKRVLNNETDVSEFRILYKGTGDIRWLRALTRPIWSDKEKRVVQAVGAMQDITDQKKSEDKIEKLAFYDPLTGFGNRRQWGIWTNVAMAQAEVHKGRLSIMYVDLDRFKTVNDTLGHDVGDGLLVEVSKRIFSCLEGEDRLARLGGDEFAMLLVNSDEQRAIDVARRILSQFDAPFFVRGHTIQSRCSIGIACYPRDGVHISVLQQHADIAMYRAKTRPERFQVYSPDISTYIDDQVRIEAELLQGIENGEMQLYYQPILDLDTKHIVKAEALLRWKHPRRGFVSPATFIPLAEQSGMILQIDRHVIKSCFAQAAEWARQGLPMLISINLSALTLRDDELLEYVADTLNRTGAPASQLMFEITESAAIQDPETTKRVLLGFREMGIMSAIDDFGIGYTSIVFLKSLPVAAVKVDKVFVDGIGQGPKDEGVLAAVLALGHGLGISVIAEGVEDARQLEWLEAHGCQMAQGFYIAKPMPKPDFESAIRNISRVL
jgi:diguanylate cyclase (GGDEF)-like protein/PAS domain S-box-containing protein